MKIALVQSDIAWNDPGENDRRLRPMLREAAAGGATLAVLPEMATCGFSLIDGPEAMRINESSCALFEAWSREFGLGIIGSFPELATVEDRPWNSLIVQRGDTIAGTYRKLHLFSYGREQTTYQPGREYLTLAVDGLRLSCFICYDLRFPQPFAAVAANTDLFVVVANWPEPRIEHWKVLLAARAIENQAYVVGVNRVGVGGGLTYNGSSRVFGPDGACLATLGSSPEVAIVEVSPAQVLEARESFPTLKDRREDLYSLVVSGAREDAERFRVL